MKIDRMMGYCAAALLGTALLLSGCQKDDNEMYYLTHPSALQNALQKCQKRGAASKKQNGLGCSDIKSLAQELKQQIQQAISGDDYFGFSIMKAQIQQVALEARLEQAQSDRERAEANHKLNEVKQFLRRKYAVIKFMFQMGNRQ